MRVDVVSQGERRLEPMSTLPFETPALSPQAARLLEGLNPQQRAGRGPRGQPAAHRRRRRVGQDQGPHDPHRLPARRPRGAARGGPRDHLHQQGRRRDEGARRRARRRPRPGDVGQHVPQRVRADPARRGQEARLHDDVQHLRPGRRAAADDAGLPRPRPRPQALPGPRDEQPDQRPEERADRPGAGREQGHQRPREDSGPRSTGSTSSGCARPTRWTSTTSS